MRRNADALDIVLGIHPTDRGFGWVVFDASPIDWGTVDERSSDKNAHCLSRIRRLIRRYQPAVVVLEEFDALPARRAPRIRRLCRSIVSLAGANRSAVAIYSRAQVRATFVNAGARSRHEIAQSIAEQIEGFDGDVPPVRKPWLNEYPRMALFNAVALVLTHFNQTGSPQSGGR